MDRKLLDLLACPVTRQPLRQADAAALARINARIAQANLTRGDGEMQRDAIEAALVTQDDRRAYRIDDGIPVLLAEEALLLEPVAGATA